MIAKSELQIERADRLPFVKFQAVALPKVDQDNNECQFDIKGPLRHSCLVWNAMHFLGHPLLATMPTSLLNIRIYMGAIPRFSTPLWSGHLLSSGASGPPTDAAGARAAVFPHKLYLVTLQPY